MPLCREVLSRYQTKVFVETGTYAGEAVDLALQLGFDRIHSVELNADMARNAAAKFKARTNVMIYSGSSGALLPGILRNMVGPVTFWLDAHPITDPLTLERTPLREELTAIAEALPALDVHAVLIDDMRVFSAAERLWMENRLKEIFPGYVICRDYNYCASDDILVAKKKV